MKKEEIEVKNNYKPISSNFKNIRVNNTFVEANKKSLTEIKNRWDKLNDHTFDKENGAIVCELLDATPTAASNSYLILTYNYDSFVEKGNMYIEKYQPDLVNNLSPIVPPAIACCSVVKKMYGEDIFDTLPEIFWDLKDSTPSIHRYRYHDFIAELMQIFRNVLVILTVNNPEGMIYETPSSMKLLKEIASDTNKEELTLNNYSNELTKEKVKIKK